MRKDRKITPPFFEIGPKNYLYGKQIVELAKIADEASEKYQVQVIFTTPYVNIEEVARVTKNIFVFAPHMDAIPVGRGLACVLPEAVKAAGADGVMLNHAERPLDLGTLCSTVKRAKELDLKTIVCADSMTEVRAVAQIGPDVIIAEPTELIGTGKRGDISYVSSSVEVVRNINKDIQVLVGAGISCGQDVYDVIRAGADATGSSSGIVKADNMEAMVHEMLSAARRAWDQRMTIER